jgi:hypothetical protein
LGYATKAENIKIVGMKYDLTEIWSFSKHNTSHQKTKYQPATDILRVPQFYRFYRYQMDITRISAT